MRVVERSEPIGEREPAELDACRLPDDDFYCLRYEVWYPSLDCAFRTLHRTSPGCERCDQGRFNLRRHRATLARTAWKL